MKKPNRPGALLRLIADLLDRLSPDEVDALLDGRSRLEVSGRATQSKSHRPKVKIADTSAAIDLLREAQTREQAMAVLEAEGITKVVLEAVARALDLPVLRSDSVDRLRQKIVEAAVGYRINSEAIRGRPSDDAD